MALFVLRGVKGELYYGELISYMSSKNVWVQFVIMRFKVLTVVLLRNQEFWNMALCHWASGSQHFKRSWYFIFIDHAVTVIDPWRSTLECQEPLTQHYSIAFQKTWILKMSVLDSLILNTINACSFVSTGSLFPPISFVIAVIGHDEVHNSVTILLHCYLQYIHLLSLLLQAKKGWTALKWKKWMPKECTGKYK